MNGRRDSDSLSVRGSDEGSRLDPPSIRGCKEEGHGVFSRGLPPPERRRRFRYEKKSRRLTKRSPRDSGGERSFVSGRGKPFPRPANLHPLSPFTTDFFHRAILASLIFRTAARWDRGLQSARTVPDCPPHPVLTPDHLHLPEGVSPPPVSWERGATRPARMVPYCPHHHVLTPHPPQSPGGSIATTGPHRSGE